jgi:hypothetical protein
MREVKRVSPVPLCAGENLYLRWGFRNLLEQQAPGLVSHAVEYHFVRHRAEIGRGGTLPA